MQRYLDQDLGETEYRRMLMHIQSCAGCAELFERLVGLSQELENLPKVTPPVSLVDSILPRLEQLDRMAAETAVQQTPAGGADRRAAVTLRARIKEWISLPVAGGVLAAGLVLGFFVFSQQSASQDGERMLISLSDNSKAEKQPAASAGASNMKRSDAQTTGSAPQQQGKTEDKAAPAASPEVLPDQSASSANQAGETFTTEGTAGKHAPMTGAAPRDTAAPSASQPAAKQPQPQPQMSDPAAGASVPSNSPAQSRSAATEGAATGAASGTQPAPTPAPAPVEGPSAKSGTEAPPEEPVGIMNMRPAPGGERYFGLGTPYTPQEVPSAQAKSAPSSSDSAGGEYTALIDETGHVAIRSNADSKIVFASKQQWAPDQIVFKGWSADFQFTYEVKLTNQTTETYVIRMSDKTEAKQAAN